MRELCFISCEIMSQLLLQSCFSNFSNFRFNVVKLKGKSKVGLRGVSCCVVGEDKRVSVVKNGKDSLDICRVVNGMWQTSGGWGRIEVNNAVDAMLSYADAGLSTFDMADICKNPSICI